MMDLSNKNATDTEVGRLKVLIADDHPIVSEGVKLALETNCKALCRCASKISEIVSELKLHHYDIFVLDLELAHEDTYALLKKMGEKFQGCKVLIYTMHDEPWIMAKVSDYNISGYVTKNMPIYRLIEAVNSLKNGRDYFCEEYQRVTQQGSVDQRLTQRERDVLNLIVKGLSSAEISEQLCVSLNTINSHRKHVMQKLGAKNTAELVKIVLQHQPSSGVSE